ncbi:hypothetical protein AWV79_13860 [Cupriavidus sp. UYMMa02A]|nr:hypothetical protein AWV79_13860 [Cupriavidus sp. UYMMa02A]
MTRAAISEALDGIPGASVVSVATLETVRRAQTLPVLADEIYDIQDRSAPMVEASHPSGYPTTLPIPSWSRWGTGTVRRLTPAPMPGTHTLEVLGALGYDSARLQALLDASVIRERWAVHQHYFPL